METSRSKLAEELTQLALAKKLIIDKKTIEAFIILRGENFTVEFLTSSMEDAIRLAEAWKITLHSALPGGVQSLCFKGHRENGSLVVLKIPSVAKDGLLEVTALRQWNNVSDLEILEVDFEGKGFLMSYIENDTQDQTLSAVVNMFASLHEITLEPEILKQFPSVEKFIDLKIVSTIRRLSNSPDAIKHDEHLEVAKTIFNTLLEYQTKHELQVLLHGDAKNHNILTTNQGLVAIDPQPCLGDKLYDIGMWVAGSVHKKPILEVISEYTADIQANGIDMQRLLLWTWALTVVENRPHHAPYAFQRQDFIDEFREEALTTLKLFRARVL